MTNTLGFVGAHPALRYGGAIGTCMLTTGIAWLLSSHFAVANIVMLFLLAVVLVTIAFGRGAGVLASFLSVALFDFFFVPPTLSFTIADAQYALTFVVMLAVALITAHLMAGLQQQAKLAMQREQRVRALYDLSRELAGSLGTVQVGDALMRFVGAIGGEATLVVAVAADDGESHAVDAAQPSTVKTDRLLVDAVLRTGQHAAFNGVVYFAVASATRVRGVLAVTFGPNLDRLAEHHELLDAVASLAAMVIERLHYVDVAARAELAMQAERLRSSILSALSHDIRTPLTALSGLADTLALSEPKLSPKQAELAAAVRSQAARVNGLATNLLDMARLNAGTVRLRKEWQPLEEVIGASLAQLEGSLGSRPLTVTLPDGLPLLEFDAVLIERVLCNLIENALKHAPSGSAIELSAIDEKDAIRVCVRDHGLGIDIDDRDRIFDPFVRGSRESSRPGVGLGLAICRAIVAAHGGAIEVTDAAGGGASFAFTLPKGLPPPVIAEPAGVIA